MGLLLRTMVLAAWCLPMDAAGAEAYLELTRFTLVDGTGQAARAVERCAELTISLQELPMAATAASQVLVDDR